MIIRDLLYNPQLINELRDYAVGNRALAVYWKCIRAGKLEIAAKIRKKYRLNVSVIDSVTATAIAMRHAFGKNENL